MTDQPPTQAHVTAQSKMMDLLAQRDHSEQELRQKLKLRFTNEEIDNAIAYAKTKHWIPDSEGDQRQLSQKTAAVLHRKNKGIHYINHQLSEKGLPLIESDSALELEKALELVKNKYSVKDTLTPEQQAHLEGQMGRFLASRGFELETVDQVIRKVIYEKC